MASPETQADPSHPAGFTILEKVYLLGGTLYIIDHESRTAFPERPMMISSGAKMQASAVDREPTDQNMQIITMEKARELFGDSATRIDGTSVSVTCEHREVT